MPRTLGEFHPLGQAGGAGGQPDDCYKLNPVPGGYSYKLGEAGSYFTPDSEVYPAAKGVADFLDALAKGLSLTGTFLDVQSKVDFQKSVDRGSAQINDGNNDLNQAGVQFDASATTYFDSGFKLTDYANKLSTLNSMMASQQADMANLDTKINSFKAQAPALDQSLANAKAQQAYANNSANYPRTSQGLAQQRTDQRNANTAVANAQTQIATNSNNIVTNQNLKNSIGAEYNATLESARQTQAQGQAETARNQASKQDMEGAQSLQSRGYEKVGQGQKTVIGGAEKYQNQQENIIGPIMESATGVRAGAQVARAVAHGEQATAIGHSAKAGLEAMARHSGNAGLTRLTGLGGSAILSATKAYDQNQRAGGTPEQGGRVFAENFGQATIRYGDMERIGAAVDTAKAILDNTSNPNREKDARDLLVQQVAPTVRVGTAIASTVMSLYPGAEVATPLVNSLGEAVAVGGQGLASVALNTADKIANGKISADVGNYESLKIGRCLVDRSSGGETSAFSTALFGTFAVGGSVLASFFDTNTDYAMRASSLVDAIARTGTGADQVTIRPGLTGD